MQRSDVVLILGSGPNAIDAAAWSRAGIDRIVAINNAWAVRSDWDDLIFPEDFPSDRRPGQLTAQQRLIDASAFVPAQNAYGGIVFAGGTMAFTAGYWALHALRPRVLAYLGCDMVYPRHGATHFYGTGAADPLRADVTLQDLGAKSARLALLAAQQGCLCVNLSTEPSELLFPRMTLQMVQSPTAPLPDTKHNSSILSQEETLGYLVPSGRYWEEPERFDPASLAEIDAQWRAAHALSKPDQGEFAA